MEKAYTKKINYILLINLLIIGINLYAILALNPLLSNKCGSELQEFEITNNKLDSITDYVTNKLYNKETFRKNILVLELNIRNDTTEFVYSLYRFNQGNDKKTDISRCLLGFYNKRVLGFTSKEDLDIILITNINYIGNVYEHLGTLIKPMKTSKFFDFIYYNKDQYKNWDIGNMFEPMRLHFYYYKDQILKPIGYMGCDAYEMKL